jgi:hypothetical protein
MGYNKEFPVQFNYKAELKKCEKLNKKEVPKPDIPLIKPNRNIEMENYNQLRKASVRQLLKKEISSFSKPTDKPKSDN